MQTDKLSADDIGKIVTVEGEVLHARGQVRLAIGGDVLREVVLVGVPQAKWPEGTAVRVKGEVCVGEHVHRNGEPTTLFQLGLAVADAEILR